MFDVIVIGGGIIGLSTATRLAKQKLKTLLIEQFSCPNTRGSANGQSRNLILQTDDLLINKAIKNSVDEWKKLEKISQVNLLLESKCLIVSEDLKLKNNEMNQEIKKQFFKGFNYKSSNLVAEKNAWILRCVKCLETYKEQFLSEMGTLMEMEMVKKVRPIHDNLIEVYTSKGLYISKSVIITCGAWTNRILRPLEIQLPLENRRYSSTYFKTDSPNIYEYKNGFPIISICGSPSLTISPIHEYPDMIKVTIEDGSEVEADRRDVKVDDKDASFEEELMKRKIDAVKNHLPDIDPCPCINEIHLSSKSSDGIFIIDKHPDYENIIIASGFGAEGFGLAPFISQVITSLLNGTDDDVILENYSLKRFESLTNLL